MSSPSFILDTPITTSSSSKCPLSQVPVENLPIVLRRYELSVSPSSIFLPQWNTITLVGTNKPLYRTWYIDQSGFILISSTVSTITFRLLFLGDVSYKINWEVFLITGTLILDGTTFIVNASDQSYEPTVSVIGTNYVQNRSIEFVCTFSSPITVVQSTLYSIRLQVYDNPGGDIRHLL